VIRGCLVSGGRARRRPAHVSIVGTSGQHCSAPSFGARGRSEARCHLRAVPRSCAAAREFIAEGGLESRITVRQVPRAFRSSRGPISPRFCVYRLREGRVPAFLELLVPRLSPHGVIVADNVLGREHVARSGVPESQRERTEACARSFGASAALALAPCFRWEMGVAYAVEDAARS